MSYLLNQVDLDSIFSPNQSTGPSDTDYDLNGVDFNVLYQRLGTYSNLKYWDSTQYYTKNTDLQNVFEFNIITGTNSTAYGTFPISNGVLIYIQNGSYMYFNSTYQFDVTVYVCAGGAGGGGAVNSGNAGGGGGGGGLAVFQLNQPSSTSFDKILFSIGAGGTYATSNANAQSGSNTTFSAYDVNETELLSCITYGGGYGGNGKNNGSNGGAGGGSGSYSNSSTNPGSGKVPSISYDTAIGYESIFENGPYSGGKGQKSGNDNGGAGGGGGAAGNGGAGGSSSQSSGAGGQGYASSFPGGPTLYLSYGGGGGASYSAQPAPAQPGAGLGGYGTSGSQNGTAASNSVTPSAIYAGSGGGGNGNDGQDSSFGYGSGANGLIVLVFTNKYASLNLNSDYEPTQYDLNGSKMVVLTQGSYLTMENSNQFLITAYVAAGGGGGGNNANSGNAGGGGGGGGVAVFSFSQDSTNIDRITYTIGAGGAYATGTATSDYAKPGGNTIFKAFQDTGTGNQLLFQCTTFGGGYGGNGKNNGGNGGAGGGSGSYSNSSTNPGIGVLPDIKEINTGIGYKLLFKNGEYSGGQGQKNGNDNGGAGGGGGAAGNGGAGGSQTQVSGAGGLGYNNSEYVTQNGPNIYLSYGGGGGAAYSTQPAPAQPGAGQGGYGTNGQQNGTAASNSVVTESAIYAGSGGGGNGNDGDSSLVTGYGFGAQGVIILVFTPK